MRKRILSLTLVLVMCLSLIPTAMAANTSPVEKFTDVPADAWYLKELEYAVYNHFISGTSETTFSPDMHLTRGQFVTILGRMMGAENTSGATKFTDVPSNAYYAPFVAWANSLGVVSGVSATEFAPDSVLTVEQLGTMLARYLSVTGTKATVQDPYVQYDDASKISGWAKDSMETMRYYGIIQPNIMGYVNPQSQVKRSYGVVCLVAFAKAVGMGEEFRPEEPVIEKPPVIEEPVVPVEPETPVEVNPIPQGTLLSGKGITAKDLAPASWANVTEFIWPHADDDFEAACNNVIYMFMHDKSEMSFTVSADFEFTNEYGELYNLAGRAIVDAFDLFFLSGVDKVSMQSPGYWKYGVYYPGEYTYVAKVTFSLDNSQISSGQRAIDRACEIHDELWRSGKITAGMTQKEKSWAYFTWMAENVEYGSLGHSASATGALIDCKAVCEGYASGYQLLLLTEGIECYRCVMPEEDHACNIAILDGQLVGIDSTDVSTGGISLGIDYDSTVTRFAMSMHDFLSIYYVPDYIRSALLSYK